MMKNWPQAWNRFFYSEVDSRVYACIRISVGFFLLIYCLILTPYWAQWFGPSGVMDVASARNNIDPDVISLFYWEPFASRWIFAFLVLFYLQSVLLLLGVFPRVQVVSLFVLLVSLHHRNNLIWEGGDVLLRITLFLMIFMPLGERWALRFRKQTLNSTASAWPLRLLQIQQSFLYFSSVGRKWEGSDWRNGDALYFVSRLNDFSGRFFSFQLPSDWMWFSRMTCWVTISLELVLAFAVWSSSTRRAAVILGVSFHLALELFMNLFLFQWLMILILLSHFAYDHRISKLGVRSRVEKPG